MGRKKKPAWMKKGSKAAKARMAKLRAKRGKKKRQKGFPSKKQFASMPVGFKVTGSWLMARVGNKWHPVRPLSVGERAAWNVLNKVRKGRKK